MVSGAPLIEMASPLLPLRRVGCLHRVDFLGYHFTRSGAGEAFVKLSDVRLASRHPSSHSGITRIITTADIFDALTADRPYRAAMPVSQALAIMARDVGTAIDMRCFAALTGAMDRLEKAAAQNLEKAAA